MTATSTLPTSPASSPSPSPSPSPWADRMLALFRIVAGLMFISAGTMKLVGFPASPVPMPPVELASQMGVGGLLETVGGLAIVLGLFTRPVAFVLAGEMAVAYFQFHAPQALFPTTNGGVTAVLYCFFYLYLVAAGPGAWSVDALLARRAARRATRVTAPARRAGARWVRAATL
ncbi:MAG TPA: DoxX family protein [Gemmatimonadaceae bacterium]|nr:DoxX family protein [Gemmatimonadaceae bacterium]